MRTRTQRIEDFEAFQKSVEGIFKKGQQQMTDYVQLVDYYGFSVCPKGRNGGVDSHLVEVFFGSRPYEQEKVVSDSFKVSTHFLAESGAELSLFRDDLGYVCIQLFPAKSKYGRQKEDCIILQSHLDPKKLLRHGFQKRLLLQLNSYMSVTCLEGKPTICDKMRVKIIRLNKHQVLSEEVQPVIALKWLGDVLKFVLTVGLSGFLLTIIEKYV